MIPAHLLDAPGNTSEFRLEWVQLPPESFDNHVIGAVLLPPQVRFPLNITACTLSAGWGTSALTMDYANQAFSSVMTHIPKSWPVERTQLGSGEVASVPDYANISGFAYPQRRIVLSRDWMRFINPTITISDEYNSTAIHQFLTWPKIPISETAIAHLLTAVLTMGLARSGKNLQWQGKRIRFLRK